MTPSQQAKSAGLASLAELSKISHVPVDTLKGWHKRQPERFEFVCLGAWLVKAKKLGL